MKWKVCGLKHPDNVLQVAKLKPDYMGFVFYAPSPRYMKNTLQPYQVKSISSDIKKVGVFVNETTESILREVEMYHLDIVQLYETNGKQIEEIQKSVPVIGCISIRHEINNDELSQITNVNYFLFDTKTEKHGGSGKKFDWSILNQIKMTKPFFIAGGVETSDLPILKSISSIYAVDINSKFEIEPGLKDIEKLQEFKRSLFI